jgi:hypothetical protein
MTRSARSPARAPTTLRPAEEFIDTTGAELSAVRHLFAAIEAGIRTTAPPATRAAMLAAMRDQQRATEREIIDRGKRRRQQRGEFARAARTAFAKQRRAERPPRRVRAALILSG